MTIKNEAIKSKLYLTFYRLGIMSLPKYENFYVDDSGFVLIINPEGIINIMGQLSYSGEFTCINQNYPNT